MPELAEKKSELVVQSAAMNEHALGTVAIKAVAVLSTTFLGTMHPTAVAVVCVGYVSCHSCN